MDGIVLILTIENKEKRDKMEKSIYWSISLNPTMLASDMFNRGANILILDWALSFGRSAKTTKNKTLINEYVQTISKTSLFLFTHIQVESFEIINYYCSWFDLIPHNQAQFGSNIKDISFLIL